MKTYDTEFQPNYAQRPGELLKEYLESRDIKVTAFAQRCGRPQKTISEILAGTLSITPETALQFERVLGLSASIWLDFENRYQLSKTQEREFEALAKWDDWIDKFPWDSMQEKGYLPKLNRRTDILLSLLNFFGVSSPSAWETYWPLQVAKMRFKNSAPSATDMHAVFAWLRRGELEAAAADCNQFDGAMFRQTLEKARELTQLPWPKACKSLTKLCASAGVVLICVPDLRKTYMRGAAYWASKDKAVVLLSDRMKEEHKIWFAFFHEAMHILHHSKKSIFIDHDNKNPGEDVGEIEKEADEKAADALIPGDRFREFLETYGTEKNSYELDDVVEYARSIKIDPSLLVARLQHEGLLSYNRMSELRRTVVFGS